MKIRTTRGDFPVTLPSTAPGGKGEHYIICPACTPSREPQHKNEKKLAINMLNPEYPWRCNHCGEAGYVFREEDIVHRQIKPLLSWPRWRDPEQKHINWLAKRGFKPETIAHFKASISNENVLQIKNPDPGLKGKYINTVCINFPYYEEGLLVNIKYRDPRKNFKLVTGATKIFYNIDAIKNHEYCIIVEGEFDAWAYHQSGLSSVVSVPNGATISEKEKDHYNTTGQLKVFNPLNLEYLDLDIDKFDHIKTIYLATDDDATGLKLRLELARRLGKERCKFIRFSDYKDPEGNPINDPNQLMMVHGEKILADSINKAYDFPIENVSVAMDYLEEIKSDYEHGRERGKSTGFLSLDPHFSWFPSWLYMENGYPNEGKTTAMLNLMAVSSYLYGDKWGIYSPENYPIKNVVDTLAEILLNKTNNPEVKSRMRLYELVSVIEEFISKHFFFVDNEDGYTPKELLLVKEELIRKKGINGFFTDPWSALNHDEMGQMREDQYIAQCLNREIRLAKKYNIVNVISHHPPKPVDVKGTLKVPHPYQLSGGAMWWNKSDVIFAIHRINRTDFTDTKIGFHVQKVKEVKLFGEKTNPDEPVILEYQHSTNRFLEREHIADVNGKCTKYPFTRWESKKQLSFDDY